jgi:HPt (histidine-containing phosphotransfer) domain-containing protein
METSPTVDAELPATDPTALERLHRFGGATLLRRMVELFLIAAPERIAAARAAEADGDVDAAERALHSLRSSSAQLGANRLRQLCEQGEVRARQGSLEGLGRLTSELDDELTRVRAWLTTACEGAA